MGISIFWGLLDTRFGLYLGFLGERSAASSAKSSKSLMGSFGCFFSELLRGSFASSEGAEVDSVTTESSLDLAPSFLFNVSNTLDLLSRPLRASRPALHFRSHVSFLLTRQKCRGPADVPISIVSNTHAFLLKPPLTVKLCSTVTACRID